MTPFCYKSVLMGAREKKNEGPIELELTLSMNCNLNIYLNIYLLFINDKE